MDEDAAVGEESDREILGVQGSVSLWKVLGTVPDSEAGNEPDQGIDIGRGEMAMWMRVVSGLACSLLYRRGLLVPLVMPGRFGDWEQGRRLGDIT